MGPGDLGRILCGLDLPTDERLIVGSETNDDAGVYRLNDETALIQTLDFFTPIVDDPFRFGQIAAANALSDVYAMGGKPLLCMNILACPVKKMSERIFQDVIAGGLDKIREADALLVGGHSIEDDELKYGLSVTGIVHPERVLLNRGARPGDILVLTKPLGIGIVATAIKGGLVSAEAEEELSVVMATLNRQAAEIAAKLTRQAIVDGTEPPIHACTDITGFGLIGHLHEMTSASGVGARIRAADLPLLPGTAELAGMGIIPGGAHSNQQYYGRHLECAADPGELEMVIHDPQTSGGLLFSLSRSAVRPLLSGLSEAGYALQAAAIGEIVDAKAGRIIIE